MSKRSKRRFSRSSRATVDYKSPVARTVSARQDFSSRKSSEVRTISPRTVRFIVLGIVIVVILFLIQPKPKEVPREEVIKGQAQSATQPIDLKDQGAIQLPSGTTSQGGLGEMLQKQNLAPQR